MLCFSLIWITSSFHMSWKHWIMMVYGKIKKIPDENQRFDWTKLIRGYRLVNTRWLADINLLNLMIWLNPLEQKHRGRIWLIRTQALQILWGSDHVLTHALNNFCRPYERQLTSKFKTTAKLRQIKSTFAPLSKKK